MVARLFTDEQEKEICKRYKNGESAIKIAKNLGACRSCISNIVKRNYHKAGPNVSKKEVSKIMKENSISQIPIVTNDKSLSFMKKHSPKINTSM